jgi:hypothetical protein
MLGRAIYKSCTLLMVLVIYHAAELKHQIVEEVMARRSLKAAGHRQTEKMKWPQALEALQNYEIVSLGERDEIAELISFPNDIAREIQVPFADFSGDKFVEDIGKFQPRKTLFDYKAANRLCYPCALIKKRQQPSPQSLGHGRVRSTRVIRRSPPTRSSWTITSITWAV